MGSHKPKGKLPKAAIAIAAVAVIALGVAGAGFATGWFGLGGPEVKESVNDYTWEELSQISDIISKKSDQDQALEVAKKYHLTTDDGKLDGTQTKDIELSDGTTAKAMIAGFNHDDKSDGSGKAGISFIFKSSVATKPMFEEDSSTDVQGWSNSTLRTWLQDDFYSELPEDLQANIIEVNKNCSSLVYAGARIYNGTRPVYFYGSAETTADKLWIPALLEVLPNDPETLDYIYSGGVNSKSETTMASIRDSKSYKEPVSLQQYFEELGSSSGDEVNQKELSQDVFEAPRFVDEGNQYQLYGDVGVKDKESNEVFSEVGEEGFLLRSMYNTSQYGYADVKPQFIYVQRTSDGRTGVWDSSGLNSDSDGGVAPGFCI